MTTDDPSGARTIPGCEFIIDHFLARRCDEKPIGRARDVAREWRYVRSRHAVALIARGMTVSRFKEE